MYEGAQQRPDDISKLAAKIEQVAVKQKKEGERITEETSIEDRIKHLEKTQNRETVLTELIEKTKEALQKKE